MGGRGCIYAHVPSHFGHVGLFTTLCSVAHQAPLCTGFSRQEYWSGLPRPPPGDLPDPRIEPASLRSPALAGVLFITSDTWEAIVHIYSYDWFMLLYSRNQHNIKVIILQLKKE